MVTRTSIRYRQRGWAGILVLLIALLIVGFLAKDALMKYGLAGSTVVRDSGSASQRRGDAAGSADASSGANEIRRAPTPIERARAVDDVVKRGAERRERAMP